MLELVAIVCGVPRQQLGELRQVVRGQRAAGGMIAHRTMMSRSYGLDNALLRAMRAAASLPRTYTPEFQALRWRAWPRLVVA
jgi:hypothetical protein